MPPPLGTIWTASARVQFIDNASCPPTWRTVMQCCDTPRHIGIALRKSAKQFPGKTLWIKSDTNGRYIPTI